MIAVLGSEFFGKRIVNALQEKNVKAIYVPKSVEQGDQLKKELKDHDIIHFVTSPTIFFKEFRTLIRCRFWRKKIVVNWIGADVRRVLSKPFWRFVTKISQPLIDVNIATSQNLVTELNSIGVKAKFQPIPVYSIYDLRELTSENKIAVYLPDRTEEEFQFYQGDMIKKLVKEFPSVEFLIIRNSGRNFNEKNAKCLEWVEDMEEIYNQVKCVIRLPLHDGTSGTVVETLSMGRSMIAFNTELPYCRIINNYDELKKHLSSVISEAKLNKDASIFIHENYNNSKLADDLISIYKSIK